MRTALIRLLVAASIGATNSYCGFGHLFAQPQTPPSPPANTVRPSLEAVAYLDQAISLIREHHINSAGANWPQIIANARALAAGATTTADTYPAIRAVLAALNQRHSFLIEPKLGGTGAGGASAAGGGAVETLPPASQLIEGRFGVVRLPSLLTLGPNGEELGRAYAASLRAALERLDRQPLCGWIVDLRENGGGNMWPMLRGLDPLLGHPPFGYFITRNGAVQQWTHANGYVFPAPTNQLGGAPGFSLVHHAAPIAVLMGPSTASSGEMTAIALIGRSRVRAFGGPSAGLTTANRVYSLADGAQLVLTETTVRDRLGRDYSGPIMPDQRVAPIRAERAAKEWLTEQCRRKPSLVASDRGRHRPLGAAGAEAAQPRN